MSLAAPTRPLPTSPTQKTADVPQRTNSQDTSRKQKTSPRRSPKKTGEKDSDSSRKERERDKAEQRLSGANSSASNGRNGYGQAPTSSGQPLLDANLQIHINDLPEESASWGANFWVTIQDPMVSTTVARHDPKIDVVPEQTQATFYACPATGETSWDPPVETFLMPLTDEGHWWELADETRGGTPYYYHTKTGETQWIRPEGFVIPLGIIQTTTSLGKRLSLNTFGRSAQSRNSASSTVSDRRTSFARRSRSYGESPADRNAIPEEDLDYFVDSQQGTLTRRRSSTEYVSSPPVAKSALLSGHAAPLSAIPASPDATTTAASTPSSNTGHHRQRSNGSGSPPRRGSGSSDIRRSASASAVPAVSTQHSLGGAAEEIIAKQSKEDRKRTKGKHREREGSLPSSSASPPISPQGGRVQFPSAHSSIGRALKDAAGSPPTPQRSLPAVPAGQTSQPRRVRLDTETSTASGRYGKEISGPMPSPRMC